MLAKLTFTYYLRLVSQLFLSLTLFANASIGQVVKTYTTEDGLLSNDIRTVFLDSKGGLWLGTLEGANYYDGSDWQEFLKGSFVETFAEDAAGDIWMSADDEGIHRYNGQSWLQYNVGTGLSSNDVISLLEDKNGNMWASCWSQGVDRFDGSTWTNLKMTGTGLGGNIVNAMIEDKKGNLWFGCSEDEWFGEPGGVSQFDGNEWQHYTTEDGLINNRVLALEVDLSGRIWVGTRIGVSVFDGTNWKNYDEASGLVNNIVLAIAAGTDGSIYFATLGGGVGVFDGTTWKSITTQQGLPSNRVFDLAFDADGYLWIATEEGLSQYGPETLGIVDSYNKPSVVLFPNPFHDHFTIQLKDLANAEIDITIFDMTGNEVYRRLGVPVEITSGQIGLSDISLNRGVYWMVLNTPNQSPISQKIIKL